MGCDIHSHVEVRKSGQWLEVGAVFQLEPWEFRLNGEQTSNEPRAFRIRNYGVFGFLADIRNYSRVPPIMEPRREWPSNSPSVIGDKYGTEYLDTDRHTHSWLTLAELLAADYGQRFVDKRDGDKEVTVCEFLGPNFFATLGELANLGAPDDVRVLFCFDN